MGDSRKKISPDEFLENAINDVIAIESIASTEEAIDANKLFGQSSDGAFNLTPKEKYDLTKPEGREAATLDERLRARTEVLHALRVPMYIVPCWLMLILSLPAINHPWLNKNAYSERVQFALIGALASDILGLCWVVTRDLFPQGKEPSKKNSGLEYNDKSNEEE